MEYYTSLFRKVEKPEKLVPILSAIAATSITAYYVKRVIFSKKQLDNNGADEIPTPPGAMFYLGLYIYLLFSSTNLNNFLNF